MLADLKNKEEREKAKADNKWLNKWQKLKEFIITNIENDEKEYDKSKKPMFTHCRFIEIFIIMEELEAEDEI